MTDVPDTMRAVIIGEGTGPQALRLVDMPVPRPGPGEVLLRVRAAGVNYADVLQRQGRYPPPPGVTEVPGLEVAGTVVACGEDVVRWRAGDAVCALLPGGGYAEYAVAAEGDCLPLPQSLSFEDGAALPEALFTVWANVIERGRLREGETFLVHGGAGGIGHIAIQVAREMGARVFATAGSAENVALCEELGAALAVNYREADFEEALRAHLGKRGIDVVLDHIGGDYVEKHLRLAARGGRIVNIAYLKGARVDIDLMPVLLKWLTLTGSTLRIRSREEKRRLRDAMEARIWPLVVQRRIRPVIHAVFPLAEAARAHAAIEGPHRGKIVLRAVD